MPDGSIPRPTNILTHQERWVNPGTSMSGNLVFANTSTAPQSFVWTDLKAQMTNA